MSIEESILNEPQLSSCSFTLYVTLRYISETEEKEGVSKKKKLKGNKY